jgi:hypothetical protein
VYVVWDPIFGGKFDNAAKDLSRSFSDKRVSYYKDPDSLAGTLWKRVLQIDNEIAWDVYFIYGANARWENEPSKPDFWMHQLFGVTTAPLFNAEKFTQELKAMLTKLEPEDVKKEKR